MIRLFVDGDLKAGARLEPRPDQARYLTQVMRLAVGAEILVFNGRDGEWRAVLAEVSKRGCAFEIQARTRLQTAGPDLELVLALVKRGPLETIVEKATELGVRRIRLVTTRRTNADHANLPRLSAIAVEAAEQTGRTEVPQIEAPVKLERLLEGWEAGRRLMFCDEAGDDPDAEWGGAAGRARPALRALAGQAGGPWAVLVGPEGGFAPEERTRLRGLDLVAPVSLGPRILRADTAAISALALWQAVLGDWMETGALVDGGEGH